jgi:hypothetical protein
MTKTILIACCLISLALLLACNKTENTANSNNASAPANRAAAASPAAPATASTGEKIGVPECDDFIAAYEACVTNKVPAAARAQFNTGLAEWRKSWKTLAANPQSHAALVTACKNAMETSKTSMKSYGCAF